MTKSQLFQLLSSLQGAVSVSVKDNTEILECLVKIRTFLIDFMVNIQEQALYESNKPSSHASSLSDELGSLIELVTT